MELTGYLKDNEKYSDSFKGDLENFFTLKRYSKGDYLFRQGDVCRHLFYINKGLVRIYYYSSKGKEITLWFSSEDTLITAIDSFYNHKPTRDNCEALEDLVVYSISHSQLEALLTDKKGAQTAFYIMYEVTRKMADLIDSIRFQSAEERYISLLNYYPAILQRVSLGQIASFLGITQETLSRIRGKI
ncbi:MAG: Crp/Fnr family transcriptional regulator [Bacteroidota bacterium]